MKKKDKSKPTALAKACIDNYYANGCDKVTAYCKAKGIKEPKDRNKRIQYNNIVSKMLNKYPEYKSIHHKENKKIMKTVKDELIETLDGVKGAYSILLRMALKEELTDEEKEQFSRLRSILSTSDLNKVIDTYAKLTGSYEPEKHNITNEFKVRFGDKDEE